MAQFDALLEQRGKSPRRPSLLSAAAAIAFQQRPSPHDTRSPVIICASCDMMRAIQLHFSSIKQLHSATRRPAVPLHPRHRFEPSLEASPSARPPCLSCFTPLPPRVIWHERRRSRGHVARSGRLVVAASTKHAHSQQPIQSGTKLHCSRNHAGVQSAQLRSILEMLRIQSVNS